MMNPYDFTWIFGVTMVLAFADAFGIGANDVANAFATSVSSGSLTLLQAVICACFTEFLGALLLGNQVSDTIRSGIMPLDSFEQQPEMLMLGMMCALFGSATWVLTASRFGWPVSTTHSIVGAIIGMGIAGFGPGVVDWSFGGVGGIIASWFISPIASGVVAAIIYMIVKYAVLKRKNSMKWGLYLVPIFFFVTTFIEAFYIIFKGAPGTEAAKMGIGAQLGIAFGIGGVFLIWSFLFFVPWLRRRVVEREQLRWYHIFITPFLSARPKAGSPDQEGQNVSEHVLPTDQDAVLAKEEAIKKEQQQLEKSASDATDDGESSDDKNNSGQQQVIEHVDILDTPFYWGKLLSFTYLKKKSVAIVLHGIRQDVRNLNSAHLKDIHAAAVKYDNNTEYMFSFLQVITALVFSFAHGSNDVANAIGPLSAVHTIWTTATVGEEVPVAIWILAYGGIAIDIGLATFGYRVMRRLGNNITYMTPTRGFSTELGAAITILTFSQAGVPVSSTHCATGATAAVGLCNGNIRAVNWKMLGWCMFAWVMTLPIAGLISGLAFSIVIYAPHFGMTI
ncbi:phosphate transporter [Zychaea mexicana]|uniref:phosphate transporter n=1 Tax=Zychaea mexicana TaxID=64656 RepID=UPI0022FF3C68|nr:phosphate transporter [Zychaea mexicana]KAI9498587.1 phosphate transporter [Zychaea mexicana]